MKCPVNLLNFLYQHSLNAYGNDLVITSMFKKQNLEIYKGTLIAVLNFYYKTAPPGLPASSKRK